MKTLLFVVPALCLGALGCSPHTSNHGPVDFAGTGGRDHMAVSGAGSGGGDMSGPLVITPMDPVLTTAPGGMPTQGFTATVNGQAVSPAWTLDRGELGSLDVSSGLFTAAGTIGGKGTITATLNGETASTTITVVIQQTQNGDPAGPPSGNPGPGGYGGVGGNGPGGAASGGQTGVLGGASTPSNAIKMLYPYDGTVWPRGLLAPLFMWDQTTLKIDAVMVKLKSKYFDYTGTFSTNNPGGPFQNLPIPATVWHTMTYSNAGQGDPVAVTLVFEDTSTGTATALGPYTMTWNIAPATLKGTVYYNSYGTGLVVNPANTAQVGNSGQHSCGPADTNCNESRTDMTGPFFGAATLAIKPGMTSPIVVAGTYSADNSGCRVCHTVSSNGSTLWTQHGDNYSVSSSYALTNMNAQSAVTPGTNLAYPALYPDGTWLMSSAGTIDGDYVVQGNTNVPTTRAWTVGGALATAQPTLPAGWTAFAGAFPSFSPDGKHLVFNLQSYTAGATMSDGKSLASLDYDPVNKVFANFTKLSTPATGVDSWSSFLPTNDAVVFENETASPAGFGFTRYNNTGQLWWVDLKTQTAHALDKLNGKGYLPTSASHTDDTTVNYEPTVNPVASGGYAWVVFTSRRLYGNVATLPPWTSDPRNYDWTEPSKTGITTKKLWVAAIDLNATPGTDPSHPAFYLPAQELVAGNARGFWTVDPCHPDGTTCETGDECCGGYCAASSDMGLVCTHQMPTCSQEYDKCTMDSQCCGYGMGVTCVNGYCVPSVPIQ